MAIFFDTSKFFSSLSKPFTKRRVSILIIGLDNSGKSTILSSLTTSNTHPIKPTIGLQVVKFTHSNLHYFALDTSGRPNARNLWHPCLRDSAAIVCVIDASDRDRISVLRSEIAQLLKTDHNKSIPILFLANKMDSPNALSVDQCTQALGLSSAFLKRDWNIVGTSGIDGTGIESGFKWLGGAIHKDNTRLKKRASTSA